MELKETTMQWSIKGVLAAAVLCVSGSASASGPWQSELLPGTVQGVDPVYDPVVTAATWGPGHLAVFGANLMVNPWNGSNWSGWTYTNPTNNPNVIATRAGSAVSWGPGHVANFVHNLFQTQHSIAYGQFNGSDWVWTNLGGQMQDYLAVQFYPVGVSWGPNHYGEFAIGRGQQPSVW